MRGMNHNMSASREKKKRQEQLTAEAASAQNAKKGLSKTVKTVLGIVIAVVLVAAIVFLGMISSGFFETHSTAAVVSGHKLTPAMVNYYYTNTYQNNQQLLSIFVDSETPLSEQAYFTDEYATWNDYLLDSALATAASTYAIYDEAVSKGFELSEDAQASIDSQLQSMDLMASIYGYGSGDAYLSAVYGTGCNKSNFKEFLTVNYLAQEYESSVISSLVYTQDEIDAYYAANPADFDSVTFRMFNLTAEADTTDENGEDAVSEEALAQVEEKAKAMAEASQGSEETFLELALENTPADQQESYNADTSTLREAYTENDCLDLYRDWISDDARQPGDTTYVYNSTNGYYVLYFVENVDMTYQLPNVRHILIAPEDSTDEASKEEAKAKAESLLADFLAGDATEDAFAALANENSEDTGSNTTGGLYENVAPGATVESFEDWCYAEGRQPGDTGIVESDYGYHIMYFSGYGKIYRDYLVENALMEKDYNAWLDAALADVSRTLKSSRFVTTR